MIWGNFRSIVSRLSHVQKTEMLGSHHHIPPCFSSRTPLATAFRKDPFRSAPLADPVARLAARSAVRIGIAAMPSRSACAPFPKPRVRGLIGSRMTYHEPYWLQQFESGHRLNVPAPQEPSVPVRQGLSGTGAKTLALEGRRARFAGCRCRRWGSPAGRSGSRPGACTSRWAPW